MRSQDHGTRITRITGSPDQRGVWGRVPGSLAKPGEWSGDASGSARHGRRTACGSRRAPLHSRLRRGRALPQSVQSARSASRQSARPQDRLRSQTLIHGQSRIRSVRRPADAWPAGARRATRRRSATIRTNPRAAGGGSFWWSRLVSHPRFARVVSGTARVVRGNGPTTRVSPGLTLPSEIGAADTCQTSNYVRRPGSWTSHERSV